MSKKATEKCKRKLKKLYQQGILTKEYLKHLPEEDRKKFLQDLISTGCTKAEISRKSGFSTATISYWIHPEESRENNRRRKGYTKSYKITEECKRRLEELYQNGKLTNRYLISLSEEDRIDFIQDLLNSGCTQAEISRKSGFSTTTISRWSHPEKTRERERRYNKIYYKKRYEIHRQRKQERFGIRTQRDEEVDKEERATDFERLKDLGYSLREIAKIWNVTHQTVRYWLYHESEKERKYQDKKRNRQKNPEEDMQQDSYKRGLRHISLNPYIGSFVEYHIDENHVILDKLVKHHINLDYIIYIPQRLHQYIRHNLYTNEGMDEINFWAFLYLLKPLADYTKPEIDISTFN